MHMLTVVFGPTSTSLAFLFRNEEHALTELESIKNALKLFGETEHTFAFIDDDFGQHAAIRLKSLHGFLLENMEESKLAHIERGLHNARTQARANQAAQSDPVLKSAMAGMSPVNPAMLSPMGNSGGRWNG